jgi:hypothetical protein
MTVKQFALIVLLFSLPILRGYAQVPTPEEETEETEMEEAETEEEMPQKGLESIWRTSDLPNETPTLRQQRYIKRIDGSALLPEGSARVGCVCMDYFVKVNIGRGACGGHNGVRFWLYALPSGDTVQIPTLRHEAHPDTLSDAQLLQLAAFKRYERLMAQKQLAFYETLEEHPDWLGNMLLYAPSALDSARVGATFTTPSPIDATAKNTMLYSLSVLIGSGALFVLNKLRGEPTQSQNERIEDLPKPKDLI